jgi:hypothetical protein
MSAFKGVVDVELLTLLQVLNLEKRSATVVVRRDEERGEIWVEGGQIVHASLGDTEGDNAFAEMAKWTRGRYHMGSARAPPKRTIKGRFEFLVMNAMRELDEQERDAGGDEPAPVRVRLRPTFQRSAGGRKPEGSR